MGFLWPVSPVTASSPSSGFIDPAGCCSEVRIWALFKSNVSASQELFRDLGLFYFATSNSEEWKVPDQGLRGGPPGLSVQTLPELVSTRRQIPSPLPLSPVFSPVLWRSWYRLFPVPGKKSTR